MDRGRVAVLLSVAGLLLLLASLGVLAWALNANLAADDRRLIVVVAVFSTVVGFLLEGFSRVLGTLRDLEERLARLEKERQV